MATIRKIAHDAGVSIATVSRVINGNASVAPELRDRVMAAVAKWGYSPTVGRKAHGCIALVYTGPFTVGSPYDSACLDGMVAAMEASPFDLQIVHLRRDKRPDETYTQYFMRKGIQGAIIRSTAAERAILASIAAEGFPAVVLGDHFEHPTLRFVYDSSRSASQEAVEYLFALGHRRIAFASCERDDGDHLDRMQAYSDVLKSHELFDDRLIFRLPDRQEDGSQLMRKICSLPAPPTAVFIADPLVAVGAINEAHKLGARIPEDISILGFDDTDIRQGVHPEMTAICQDSRALGRRSFQVLAEELAEAPSATGLMGAAWLEIHQTTGPAPSSGK